MQGCYVLKDSDIPLDAGVLAAFFAGEPELLAFLFIENPASDVSLWRVQRLYAETVGRERRLAGSQICGYIQYQIHFPDGALFCWEEKGRRFLLKGKETSARCFFASSKRESGALSVWEIGDEPALCLMDKGMGQLCFHFSVGKEQSGDFFERLDACIRYQTYCEVLPEYRRSIYTTSLYPSLTEAASMEWEAAWNLCDPLNETETCLAPRTGGLALSRLFQTIYGEELKLIPEEDFRLVLQRAVKTGQEAAGETEQQYYLGFIGCAHLEVGRSPVLCGMNGNEYVENVCGDQKLTVKFTSGSSAFLSDDILTEDCQTSYPSFLKTVDYYVQPQQSELFSGAAADQEAGLGAGTGFALEHFSCSLVQMETTGAFPYYNHSFCDELHKQPEINKRIERVLEKARYENFIESYYAANTHAVPDGGAARRVTTSHGLLLEFCPDENRFTWLGLARTGQEILPKVRFTAISREFSAALQQEQMFLVLQEPDIFLKYLSIPYEVGADKIKEIGSRYPAIDLTSLSGMEYEDRNVLDTALRSLNPEYVTRSEWHEEILRCTANLRLQAEDWSFQLSPHSFRSNRENSDTVIIFKYYSGLSVYEMAKQNKLIFPHGDKDVMPVLNQALASAYDENGEVREGFGDFIRYILGSDWCGILCLNVPVYCEDMPPELSLVADSLDPERFYALYAAIEKNAVELTGGRLDMKPSVISALIDYRQEYSNTRNEKIMKADFRTTSLFLRIARSRVEEYKSVSELTMEDCFHVAAQKLDTATGNDMVVDGTYQKNGDIGQYVFTLREETVYGLKDSLIRQLAVTGLELSCQKDVKSFNLSGGLSFIEQPECDLLGYGGGDSMLFFSRLKLVLNHENQGDFQYGELCFHPEKSIPRSDSLVNRFAASFFSFSYIDKRTMEELGFSNLSCPLRQGKPEGDFYLLTSKINLGSLGGLASSLRLEPEVGISWDSKQNLYVGIRLNNGGASNTLAIQSVLKCSFKSIVLKVSQENGHCDYQLQFKDFKISFAGFSAPPGKNTIFIFADPENPQQLGWFGAYAEEESDG